MIMETVNAISSFITAHPHWIGLVIFAATALESMAFIGSLFPGMTIVLAVSGVAASLGASIWMLVLWCTLGAIVGDGASFWIGHRYGNHLKSMWPFRKHPEYLEKGTDFFQQNGGKSIIIGRFLPFTRAVVPVAAGMLGMNPVHFYMANIVSAIGWALMNVLPAAGVGLAFTAINQTSSRLAVMLAVFVAVFILAVIIGHITVRFILPHMESMVLKLTQKSDRNPKWVSRVMTLFVGSDTRTSLISAIWIILIVSLVLSFVGVLEDVIANDPLVRMDVAINALVQGFRSQTGDQIMTVVTSMGDMTVVLSTSTFLVVSLLLLRAWRTAGMAFVVLLTTSAFVPLLKTILHKPRPFDLYSGADAFSFPSGHASFSAVVLGMIAVIAARGLPRKTQATIWAVALTVSIWVGLSRIYLSAHWPSDVIGGLLFGWIMAALFGLMTTRMQEPVTGAKTFVFSAIAVLMIAWGYHATVAFEVNMVRYQPERKIISIVLPDWCKGDWQQISWARIDLKGEYEEPLSFQIAMPHAIIKTTFKSLGWVQKTGMGWRQLMSFFGSKKGLDSLTPLPLLHNGKAAVLTMVKNSGTNNQRLVFRLWPTDVVIGNPSGPSIILAGSITQEQVTHPVTGINILRDKPSSADRIDKIISELKARQELFVFQPTMYKNKTSPLLIFSQKSDSCQNNIGLQ